MLTWGAGGALRAGAGSRGGALRVSSVLYACIPSS